MFPTTPPEDWSSEFRALGTAKVLHELAQGRWPRDKLAAARQWIQLEDVRSWQKRAPAHPAGWSSRFRDWARYFFSGIALLYTLARLFRIMRFGQ